MKKSLVIVYSNLGLGGIPIQIMDITNSLYKTNPQTPIYIIIKERRLFDICSGIKNPSVTYLNFYEHCSIDSGALFMIWAWYKIYQLNPATILTFISPYGLTVLAMKILFFWRRPTIIINEAHFTSTMLSTMTFPILQSWGIRLLYPLADTIITPTRAVFDDLHRVFNIPKRRMSIIANWSRYALDKPTSTPRLFDIIYTGRIERSKNILQLLEICALLVSTTLPKLHCLIIGDGAYRKECLGYIRAHKLQNHIIMKKPVIHIAPYIKRAKLFVFIPHKKMEGFPISLLDAISLGTLVITTEFSGVKEVFNSSNSIIVQTHVDLVKKISFALSHYEVFQERIKKAKNLAVNNYSIHNALKYIRLFNL